uniref:BURP domain RD22-like protein n=1 Tax=Pohlia nutans TaxID=140635 RepID=A0A4P8JG03_9BRYO|nr:BURP domain RD22-like protein [Pohlia nutans]
MAGRWIVVPVSLLAFLVVAVAATQVSNAPALSHWEETLPAVTIPSTLRGSVSPVDGSVVATRFATAISRGAIFPATTASFCRDAGLMCEEDVDISPYTSVASTLGQEGTGGRALGIKTINDFQFDFFLEKNLVKGAMMNLVENLHDPIPKRAFLPKEVADTLPPLTTSNLPKLTQTFNIGERTKMATIMATATYLCENPPLPGEERACPTSVEAMAEFVASQLGKEVKLLATQGAPEAAPEIQRPVTVVDFTKRSLDEGKKIVICHNLMFPSQLYYCHHVTGTKVVQGSLAAADGSTIHGVAICHLDTTMWSSEHPAFAALNIPRGAEACHWTAQNDMIWVPSHL